VIFPFKVPIVVASTMMIIVIKELEAEKRHYT